MVGSIIRMSLPFPQNLKNESARCRSLQFFFISQEVTTGIAKPTPLSCSLHIKAVMPLSAAPHPFSRYPSPLSSSYDDTRHVFCCQRGSFLDIQRPPPEPAFQLLGGRVSIPGWYLCRVSRRGCIPILRPFLLITRTLSFISLLRYVPAVCRPTPVAAVRT